MTEQPRCPNCKGTGLDPRYSTGGFDCPDCSPTDAAADDTDLTEADIARMMANATPVQIAPAPVPLLRDQVAAAINYALLPVMPRAEYRAHAASHAADAVLNVRDQQLAETRDALRVAEGDRDAYDQGQQQLREEVARLKTEADDSDEAARRALDQRQEMAEERYAWQERGDRAEAELARLHEGEESYIHEATVATPAQLIWLWNRATPQRRLEMAERIQRDSGIAHRCFMGNHEGQLDELREARAASTAPLAAGLPVVKGRCPACGSQSLFLGDGGYVTCSRIDCPEPDAASTLLERPEPAPAISAKDCCGKRIGHYPGCEDNQPPARRAR